MLGAQLSENFKHGADDDHMRCGKQNLHLEPEDLVALTVEAAAMARLPLAGLCTFRDMTCGEEKTPHEIRGYKVGVWMNDGSSEQVIPVTTSCRPAGLEMPHLRAPASIR